MVGSYGDLVESTRYARVQAGFYHPNLLASYCTFVSAGVAGADGVVPRRLRRAAQIVLCCVVLATLSRAILGFFVGMAVRAGVASGTRSARAARRRGQPDRSRDPVAPCARHSTGTSDQHHKHCARHRTGPTSQASPPEASRPATHQKPSRRHSFRIAGLRAHHRVAR